MSISQLHHRWVHDGKSIFWKRAATAGTAFFLLKGLAWLSLPVLFSVMK